MGDGATGEQLPRTVVAGYAAGSVGTGGFATLPGLVLAYYLTDTLGVAALVASVVVVVPKLLDVAVNPFIGARSDVDAARRGHRRRLMAIGSFALFPLFVLTFLTPGALSPTWASVWVLVVFSLAAVAYGLFQVPYVALPTDLTADSDQRTRLVTTRIVVLAATILVVGAGGPAIRDAAGGGRAGYAVMAVVVGAVIFVGMLVTTFGVAARASTLRWDGEPVQATGQWRPGFAALADNPDFRRLLAVFVLQALASAIMLAGAQYVATYVLSSPTALTIMFAALIAPAILVMPLWARIGRRAGKLTGLMCSSTVFLVAACTMVIAVWAPGWWIMAPVAAAGIGYAGMQAFPLALLPDIISADAQASGHDRGGAMSGVWTAGETTGLTLGPGVFLVVLACGGFVSSTAGVTHSQSSSAITAIVIGFSLVPAALVALSLLTLKHVREPRVREPITREVTR